ncbi:MAG: ABC transporter ATP-binding protein [Planctomycetaceae bacterium]|jgi:ABC-2 type transport system ATP-binding protein|nr:ABC transporter ATP-binding protein [Planctomycetaceae bacterium]
MGARLPSSGERIVDASGLTKTFSDFWMRATARAVDGIDFHIDRHEIFGLLGPNGSGKSTTIKMILGLLRRTRGKLVVFDRDPTDVAVKRKIGYLPEETYLYRFLNPTETLDYYGKLFGLDRKTRRRRTDELLEMVGLSQVAHRPAGEFSKGMARRLGLAQALVNDPELLILDEPTSGLDPLGTRQVKDLILELGRRGKTILLTSHLLADVEDVCSRMVILYGGRIRAQGTSEQLLSDSRHTLIRVPRVSQKAIQAIDEALHRIDGVGIEAVSAPRQTLEELFLDIVEKARAEQVATSGAQSGGSIASFLKADEGASGDQLVDSLVKSQDAAPVVQPVARPSADAAKAATDAGVLQDLMQDKPAPTPVAKPVEPAKPDAAKGQVDLGVIDSLLGDVKKDREGGA